MEQRSASQRLSFFPVPFPDELLDSVMYRYHRLSGNVRCQDTLEQFFDKRRRVIVKHMESDLDSLYSRIPDGLFSSSDDLIKRLTMLPAFSVLLPKDSMDDLKSCAHRNRYLGTSVHTYGIVRVLHSEIHCCPQCIREEIEKYGTAYWHRTHQLEGVQVCHLHGCDLVWRCPHCSHLVRAPNSMDLPSPKCLSCNQRLLPSYSYPESVRELAGLAHDALAVESDYCYPYWMSHKVASKVGGDTASFCAGVQKRYGSLYCAQRDNECNRNLLSGDWLDRLLTWSNKKNFRYPTFSNALVLMHAFFGSWNEFISRPNSGYSVSG